MKSFCVNLLAIIIICCLGIIVYSNTFLCSFHLDDVFSIVDNLSIKNIFNLQNIWNFWPCRFITYLSIALNYHFHQLGVFGYHLFNLGVHVGSTILVWWLIRLTFSTPKMKDQKIAQHSDLISFFTGVIFITHPIQTQGVTYIIQRAASLAALFYLASLGCYVKSRLLQQGVGNQVVSRYFYSFSLIAAVIAMFTKEITITLPLMICLYEFSFFRIKRGFNWKHLVPFLFTLFIIPFTMLLTRSVNFVEMRRTIDSTPGISPWHYLLTQFRVMITYIRLVFLPLNQNLDYDYPIAKTLLSLPILVSLFCLVSILILAIKLFRNYRLIAFSIFWFFLTLLPESSTIPIMDVIFEHRLYLPMVGYSLFLVSGLYYLFKEKRIKFTVSVLCLFLIFYSILAYQRNKIWKDEFTLWSDTIRKSPHKARAYFNRGKACRQKGNFHQAILDYNKAIDIDPNYADAYNNRGNVYLDKGDLNQAIFDYTKAIKLNSNFAVAYCNRGSAYDVKDSFDQVISDYTKSIELDPGYALAYYNRAVTYYFKQEYIKAWDDLRKAELLGFNINFDFQDKLKKAVGEEK